MKKIVLMMLVAMVPFLTMAQKRSKKGKKIKTEKIVESNSAYNFMVITGIQMTPETGNKLVNKADVKDFKAADSKIRKKIEKKMKINFDFGGILSPGNLKLMKAASLYITMAAAVNGAANEGWEFISANLVNVNGYTTHHYYMKRNK